MKPETGHNARVFGEFFGDNSRHRTHIIPVFSHPLARDQNHLEQSFRLNVRLLNYNFLLALPEKHCGKHHKNYRYNNNIGNKLECESHFFTL
jgi:hypothetical protein